ncbi:MAG: hypothetical protein KAU02_06530, partial [Tenericutes bacterium]|nr:hypothetical protein [Mycoplasmatota bacterium]
GCFLFDKKYVKILVIIYERICSYYRWQNEYFIVTVSIKEIISFLLTKNKTYKEVEYDRNKKT